MINQGKLTMRKPSIICVDDENIILHSLKEQLLPKFGDDYNIETADNPEEALSIFEEFCENEVEIPLVISDYIMPGMKGDELLKCIREIKPQTVTVLLTGQATLEGITNAVNYGGVFRCLTKPWDKENLNSIVSQALSCYYDERLREVRNNNLRQFNDQLEQTVQIKAEEVKKSKDLLAATSKINYIGQLVESVSNEVNNSLCLMKSKIDTMQTYEEKVCKDNTESITIYMKSVDEFYKITSKVIDNLVHVFERSRVEYMLQSAVNGDLVEILDTVLTKRNYNFGSSEVLTSKAKDIKKQFGKSIEKVAAWEDEEMFIFDLDNVLYFTSEDGNTFVETKNGKYKTKYTLDVLETKLDTQNFFRCHRGFLVNLNYISRITPWGRQSYFLKLEGSLEEIPISRGRLKEMKDILGI